MDARTYVMGLMKDAGLEVRVDAAGNIFGRRAGTAKLPTLLFGSHIDSVPHGGNFDGTVGSLGAIEAVSYTHLRQDVELLQESDNLGAAEITESVAGHAEMNRRSFVGRCANCRSREYIFPRS